MEKTDKRWKRRTNDGKDGQMMEKTDKRWKRRTNDGKDGQTMEKTDAFSNRPCKQRPLFVHFVFIVDLCFPVSRKLMSSPF